MKKVEQERFWSGSRQNGAEVPRESHLHCHIFDHNTTLMCRKLLNTTILSTFPARWKYIPDEWIKMRLLFTGRCLFLLYVMMQLLRLFVIGLIFFFLWRNNPQWARASSFTRVLDQTQRRITVGRTPLNEWSARRRDLYLTTHNIHNRQTSTPPVGFEPTISAGERPQTYALDRAVTGTGCLD